MEPLDFNEQRDDILAEIADEARSEVHSDDDLFLSNLIDVSEYKRRYDIIDEIGEGGMKLVYKALDNITRREVALAYIRFEKFSAKTIRYFIQESWLTAGLEHPNIVPIYDIGVAPSGNPYFTMKLLDGETLRSILSKLDDNDISYCRKFSERYLLSIFLKVCDAVYYAHERGVVHLDLKPDNIQVSDYGQVFVLDWGIANVLQMHHDEVLHDASIQSSKDYTRFSSVKGTPGFIAPELTKAKTEPDYKADIYGLGAILYSMLVYQRPDPFEDVTDTQEEVGFHRNTLGLLEEIPAALQSVIRKAMSLSPEDRYSTVVELKNEGEAFLAGHATRAEEASFIRQQVLLIKRNLRFFTTIVFSVLLIIALTAAFIMQLSESEQQARENANRALMSEKRALENEKRALAQEQIATENELVANDLLTKYKAEQELRKRTQKTSARHYTSKVQLMFSRCEAEKGLKAAEECLKLYPGEEWIKALKMQLLLVTHRFDTLITDMPEFSQTVYFEIAQKYSTLKKKGLLLDHLDSFFGDMMKVKAGRKFNFLCNMFVHINKGKTFPEQKDLLEKVLNRYYPGSTLTYDPVRDRVTLRARKDFAAALLAGLDLKQLDLSGVRLLFSDYICQYKKLEYLNLKGSVFTDFLSFNEVLKLKYLNLQNTPIPFLNRPNKVIKLDYFNVADTSIRHFFWDMIRVDTLNIVGADNFDIEGCVASPYRPKTLLVSPSQAKLVRSLIHEGIQLHVYEQSDDVDESIFF